MRATLLTLVLATAAVVAAPVTAQFGLNAGIGDAFKPAFSSRDVQLAADMLDLDEAQRFILETLFEDYNVEFRTGVDAFRDRIAELRNEIDPDNPDPGQIMRVVFGNVDEWRAESQQIADRFVEDLQSLLNEDQLAKWPKFQRRLFRAKYLGNGQLSAESLDLVTEVTLLGVSAAQMEAVAPLLERYEIDLDEALRQREQFLSESQAELIKAVQEDDPRVGMSVAQGQVELREAVRNVNERYVEILAAALPAESSEQFLQTIREKTYPRIYRPTQADRVFKAALLIPDLSPETKDAIQEVYTQYLSELDTFNARLVEMVRTHEPKEIRNKVEMASARLSGGQIERLVDPTREAYGERRDMAQRYVDQLRSLLTPEQFSKLPGSRRWLSPEERAAMAEQLGELPSTPAGPGMNKLDRRRQSTMVPQMGDGGDDDNKEAPKKSSR